ncbi:aldo/keto reductase family domain-containing protein [Ditylenchus destructor]|uniref:Aldo/keto reductase family domain-containing protein n=1 Tax=Ditylenchus destructor TaxID=166010 RepID=A0AAD4RAD9_9BILA|nr:aldo/keto reductase family domain-containing protein [Ditylenchus destructor]
MAKVPSVKLSNGIDFPLLGLGTWQSSDKDELFTALREAIKCGYRYIDTAYLYGNEALIGEFLQEIFKEGKLKREDIFITTKLPFYSHEPSRAEAAIKHQLECLQTDYIDLYLMHNACGVQPAEDGKSIRKDEKGQNVPDLTPYIDTWRVFERFYKAGKFRAIGISNFNPQQVQDLYDQAEIKPHNLQIELHIYNRRTPLVELCRKLDISITSYATLGSPGRKAGFGPGDWPDADCLGHPLVQELAKKYNKTPAQILLRHMIQLNVSVIPKSINPARICQNFDVLDFKISDDDMKRFDTEVKETIRLFSFSFAKNHPRYPCFET